MKINKTLKKCMAVLCAFAMIVTSITISNVTAKAELQYDENGVAVIEFNNPAPEDQPVQKITVKWDTWADDATIEALGISTWTTFLEQEAEGYEAHGNVDYKNCQSSWRDATNLDRTLTSNIVLEIGKTYTVIVVGYNADGKVVARGTTSVTVRDYTDAEKEENTKKLEAKAITDKYDEALVSDDRNLAKNKNVIVDAENGTDAVNITNGNVGDRWQAKDHTLEKAYFGVNLGEVQTINKIIIRWEASKADAYEIYVSNDGENYGEAVATATVGDADANGNYYVETTFDEVEAQYVKVVATSLSANAATYGISVFEFGVFHEAATIDGTPEAASYNWDNVTFLGNGTTNSANTNMYKAVSKEGTSSIINVQPYNGIEVIYATNLVATKMLVNGTESTEVISVGDQQFIKLTAFTYMYNDVEFYNSEGVKVGTLYIYYANGINNGSGTGGDVEEPSVDYVDEISGLKFEENQYLSAAKPDYKYAIVGENLNKGTYAVDKLDKADFGENNFEITAGAWGKSIKIEINGNVKINNTGNSACGGDGWISYAEMNKPINKIVITFVNGDMIEYVETIYVAEVKQITTDYISYEDITTFNIDSDTPDGKIFAGWYKDKDNETGVEPYMEKTGSAYAKFVNADVLTAWAQLKEGDDTNEIRFLSSVDGLDYEKVGFSISGTYGDRNLKAMNTETKTVYTYITAGEDQVYPNAITSSNDSKFIFTHVIKGLNKETKLTVTVTPYWVTADGTKVNGAPKTFDVQGSNITVQ